MTRGTHMGRAGKAIGFAIGSLAVLAIGITPPTLAADPAPVARPDALQQPLTDGCQRNPAGLLTFTSPEWVYVYSHSPGIVADPTKARVVEGTATDADPASGDLPQ